MPDNSPTPSTSSTQALELVREELFALDPRTLLPVNVDVASAALAVIGALPQIERHRPALVALVGEEMTSSIDRLELLARAALQAHAKHRRATTGVDLQPLVASLVTTRDVLLAEVRCLIVRGALAPHVVRELALGTGHKNLCIDVLQLVSTLRDEWPAIERETRIAIADLDRAEGLANELVTAIGAREQPSRSPSADLRDRAYTALARTYDRVRRMITFLRWDEGDADRIAPAFHNNRGSRRRKRLAESEPLSPSEAGVSDAPQPSASPLATT